MVYVTSVLPAEGQSLKGDEVDKIVKFKSALGIDDPDAASMHMEIGRRIFRQRLETGEREGDAEQRRLGSAREHKKSMSLVVEELEKVLEFNNLLVSLKSHSEADQFARGLGPISLIDALSTGRIEENKLVAMSQLRNILGLGTREAEAISVDVTSKAYRKRLANAVTSGDLEAQDSKAKYLQKLCEELHFDAQKASAIHEETEKSSLMQARRVFTNYIRRARAAENRTESAKELKKMIAFNTLVVTEMVADIKGESSDKEPEEPIQVKEVDTEVEEWGSLESLKKTRPDKELAEKMGKPGQTEITLKDDLPDRDRIDLYKTYLLYCLTGEVTRIPFGAQITTKRDDSEYLLLNQLGGILGLTSKEIVNIHVGLAEQAFRQQAEVILADGQLTKARVEQLDELQKQVGLPQPQAEKVIKNITTTKMANAIETAVNQGRLNIKQIRELKEANVSLDSMIAVSLREKLFKKTVNDIFSSGTGEFDETEVYETIPSDLSIDVEKAKGVVHDLARSRLSNSLIQSVALLRQRNRKGVSDPKPAPEKVSRLQYLLGIDDSTATALREMEDGVFSSAAEEGNFQKQDLRRRFGYPQLLHESRYLLRTRRMPETKAVSTLDNVVVKSPNDRRLYRVIELENGLSALLIHDPDIYPEGYAADQIDEDDEDGEEEEEDSDGSYEDDEEGDDEDDDEVEGKGDQQTKKAAAAMCVAMGSFLDPPEAQGLAHFLEHMLFMGSSEFPDENEYDSYLSKHGGSSNAYTEMEHTCYHFEVKREFLQGALKRFSQFFVAPLMKTEAMEREVLAVDSGNKKSLSGAMENGVDLRECIMKLYKEYYHGGLMKLVVIGGESLDTLESWVVELFGDVKNGSKIMPTLEAKGPIWEGEGKGSLLSFLKGKGWATSLSAGVGDDGINRSSLAYVFGMSIHLTDSGLEKLLRDASPQEWIFKELQDIGNMDFRYAEEQAADDYAAELSELKVFGFNEKIPALLSKILAIAKSFMPSLDRFKIFIEALCHGNLSEDEAVNISNIFKNSLTVEPLPVKSRHGEQITCFPLSAKLVRDVNVKNKSETNSVVELYYQIEPEEAKSTRMKAVLDLFSEIIEEPLFNQLRTKEQLGYVVECGPRLTYRVHGFCFCVQSSKYGPVHLLGRIDNFIKDIEGMLEQLDEESFEDYRSGLIGRLLEKDPSLLSETNELWSQIVDQR
ncbi:hypothetical protein HID58_079227 [Brassica napus]|uniref:Uncharacterized protein n=1 Tax=Brassica napus TaxID=3708 RepID=A0ABQ7Y460_BRANA|nr:hypothetical protein HID58_079227 [Brassica napus]